jgi:Ca2+-binding RTX toxin-like protein
MTDFFTPATFFFNPPAGGAGVVPQAFFLGDINGDGRLDAVLTYELYPVQNQAVAMRVLLGDGAGGFTDGTASVFPAGAPALVNAHDHVLADFNGDGKPDLFLANTGYDAQPYPGGPNGLYLSGSGSLASASGNLPGFADYTASSSGGDIDGDGDTDLLLGTLGSRGPYFLINDGSGHFQVDQTRLPASVSDPANGRYPTALLFDANGDGKPDLFLGGDGDSKVLLNDGTGHFAIPAGMTYPIAGNHLVVSASAADLDGDGRTDLVLTVALDNFSRGAVEVLMNQGNGVFVDETAARIAGGSGVLTDPGASAWIYGAPLVDVNGDGAPDILLTGGTSTGVLLNDGEGHFAPVPGLIPNLSPLDRLTAGDVNGDGRTDILVRHQDSGGQEQLTVYLGVDPGPTIAGGAGNDGLMGDASAETVNGGGGNDVIFGAGGDDYLRGDDGNDQIYGGAGFDDINGNVGNDTEGGGAGPDWVVGGKDNDLLHGDEGGDIVYGNLGDDTCDGGADADLVRGGQGNDVITGGTGNDWLSGDRGDDTLTGGPGADIFHSFGDAGIDRVTDFNLAEGDRVQLDPGTTYTVSQAGADTVIAMTGGAQLVLVGVQASSLTEGTIFLA